MIGANGWYIDDVRIASAAAAGSRPDLAVRQPALGIAQTLPLQVTITGTGFSGIPSLQLGDVWLEDVVVVDGNTITATVPAGLLPGTYDLTLYNGDCQQAVLVDAFTVRCYPPLQTILPPDHLEVKNTVRAGLASAGPPYIVNQ